MPPLQRSRSGLFGYFLNWRGGKPEDDSRRSLARRCDSYSGSGVSVPESRRRGSTADSKGSGRVRSSPMSRLKDAPSAPPADPGVYGGARDPILDVSSSFGSSGVQRIGESASARGSCGGRDSRGSIMGVFWPLAFLLLLVIPCGHRGCLIAPPAWMTRRHGPKRKRVHLYPRLFLLLFWSWALCIVGHLMPLVAR